jgi:hypothetical protein
MTSRRAAHENCNEREAPPHSRSITVSEFNVTEPLIRTNAADRVRRGQVFSP